MGVSILTACVDVGDGGGVAPAHLEVFLWRYSELIQKRILQQSFINKFINCGKRIGSEKVRLFHQITSMRGESSDNEALWLIMYPFISV